MRAVRLIELGALGISLALNVALVWSRAHPARQTTTSSVQDPQDGRPAAPAVKRRETDTTGCESQLTSLRADVDRAAEELRRVLPPHELFRLGAPNEAARARLATVLAPILAGDAGSPPEHTFECRDFVCRLSVIDPAGGPSADRWLLPLQRASELRRYTRRGLLFRGGGWLKDPVTGEDLQRRYMYITLLRADGAPEDEGAGGR